MRCGWWNRWLHRRLRFADRSFMLPVLAGRFAAEYGEETPEANAHTLRAFRVFMEQQGQEHWHCACGQAERNEVEGLWR